MVDVRDEPLAVTRVPVEQGALTEVMSTWILEQRRRKR